jgi:XFP C-terminal domain
VHRTIREALPDLKVRAISVTDLMRLQPDPEHPHGISDRDVDALLATDEPQVFAFHGCEWLIYRLTNRAAATWPARLPQPLDQTQRAGHPVRVLQAAHRGRSVRVLVRGGAVSALPGCARRSAYTTHTCLR